MRDKAKKCPKCQTPIEKSDGCNKMTCHRCNTYFCYLCEAYLPRHNPYGHFSDRTTMCYKQLFQVRSIFPYLGHYSTISLENVQTKVDVRLKATVPCKISLFGISDQNPLKAKSI